MRISFHGATKNVTGSKHLVCLENGKKILLDCGMFQGMGEETDALNEHFGFNPMDVDYMVLSHAHIDHSGLIPRLVAQGFQGPIYTTAATMDLVRILLMDSARIQQQDTEYSNKHRIKNGLPLLKPLYSEDDAMRCLRQFRIIKYNEKVQVDEDIMLELTDVGHIIGSAAVHLSIREHDKTTRITFSGDVGRYGDLILKSPQSFAQSDYIILESTYGDSLHDHAEPSEELLREIIYQTCILRGGKVIIPAFSVGRTQEILYSLNHLEERGILPDVNYYVDSPLSIKATQIVKNHPENFNKHVQDVMLHDDDPFNFNKLIFIQDTAESKALNTDHEPSVIISASGMAEAGRVKHHIKNNISNENNTILMVGYCEPSSLGGRLMAGYSTVSIFGEEYSVKAEVRSIRSMSAHGDYKDLLQFISCQNPKKVKKLFLVHGEEEVQKAFKLKIEGKGYEHVIIPDKHQEFILD